MHSFMSQKIISYTNTIVKLMIIDMHYSMQKSLDDRI